MQAGRLDWRDATTLPAAELAVSDFAFAAQAIGWPLAAPVVFKGEGVLGTGADHGKLTFAGQGNTATATLQVTLAELPVAPLRPYLRSVLVPPLAGDLSAESRVTWHAGDGPPRFEVDAKRLALAAPGARRQRRRRTSPPTPSS